MTQSRLLGDPSAVKALAARLAALPEVAHYDAAEEREAWTIAISLQEMEESFYKLFGEYVPRLLAVETEVSAAKDILLQIGEELRHVLYHIRDPRFFRYIEPGDSVPTAAP